RENKYMYDVAHVLSPATRAALAKQFRGLNAKPLGGSSKKLVAMGKKIYEEGVPETNVPACMACHGSEAKGQDAIPRLAGQLHDYFFNKLVNWNKERGQDPKHPDISAVMLPTSHNLTKSRPTSVICSDLSRLTCRRLAQGIKCESPDDEIRQVKNSGPGTRCLCCPLVGRGHGDRQIPELHVVPRRNGARLWGRATIGRAETPIY